MPRCADYTCGRWRPERLAPRWAAGIRFNGHWYCSRTCVEHAARIGNGVGKRCHRISGDDVAILVRMQAEHAASL